VDTVKTHSGRLAWLAAVAVLLGACGGSREEGVEKSGATERRATWGATGRAVSKQDSEAMAQQKQQQDAAFGKLYQGPVATTDQGQSRYFVADFDGDGYADILSGRQISFRNGSDARRLLPANIIGDFAWGHFVFSTQPTDEYQVEAVGDFNGDGKADIVIRKEEHVRIKFMNGVNAIGDSQPGGYFSSFPINVKIEAAGDFNGDGRDEILWRNQTTGRTVLSQHDASGAVSGWSVVSNAIAPNVALVTVADINGDGKDDTVWRNGTTGRVVMGLMNGAVPTWVALGGPSPIDDPDRASLPLAGGDFDGNGRAGLLWRHPVTGRTLMSRHNTDGHVESWHPVSSFIDPKSISVQGVGDFDGDGKDDILWRNLGSGDAVFGLMNGPVPRWHRVSFDMGISQETVDTGVTDQQCYSLGSDVLGSCNHLEDPMQDAMQRLGASRPIEYVPLGLECSRDRRGLVWEVKEASGLRAGQLLYTHFDNADQPQKADGTNPTQSEINATTNAAGYVDHVNSIALCGFTDWRLPTADEAHGLVNYSVAYPGMAIHQGVFPNIPSQGIWTSNQRAGTPSAAHFVDFRGGFVRHAERGVSKGLQLVRGSTKQPQACPSKPSGQRYFRAEDNNVKDPETRLVWARCSVGQTWTGSGCFGAPAGLTHDQALQLTKDLQRGGPGHWRLPTVKELASLADKACEGVTIDTTQFPGTAARSYWASTPFVANPANAWRVGFGNGEVAEEPRSNLNAVRLVYFQIEDGWAYPADLPPSPIPLSIATKATAR
jgi:hypothetical protein